MSQLWHPRARKVIIPGTPGLTPAEGRPKCVLHTTQGSSVAGAEGAYRANRSTPTFTISPWALHQHIPANLCAYSLEHPPGTPETNRAGIVIQVEQVGFADPVTINGKRYPGADEWSDAYYERIHDLARWIHDNVGVPLERIPGVLFKQPTRIDPLHWAHLSGFCGHVHVPSQPAGHSDPGRHYHIGKVL